jgi:hypothetical protein
MRLAVLPVIGSPAGYLKQTIDELIVSCVEPTARSQDRRRARRIGA